MVPLVEGSAQLFTSMQRRPKAEPREIATLACAPIDRQITWPGSLQPAAQVSPSPVDPQPGAGPMPDVAVTTRWGHLVGLPPHFLARTLPRQCLLCPALVARLQIVGVPLNVLDDIFLLDLALEATERAFD